MTKLKEVREWFREISGNDHLDKVGAVGVVMCDAISKNYGEDVSLHTATLVALAEMAVVNGWKIPAITIEVEPSKPVQIDEEKYHKIVISKIEELKDSGIDKRFWWSQICSEIYLELQKENHPDPGTMSRILTYKFYE